MKLHRMSSRTTQLIKSRHSRKNLLSIESDSFHWTLKMETQPVPETSRFSDIKLMHLIFVIINRTLRIICKTRNIQFDEHKQVKQWRKLIWILQCNGCTTCSKRTLISRRLKFLLAYVTTSAHATLSEANEMCMLRRKRKCNADRRQLRHEGVEMITRIWNQMKTH
jgi:hypothetical protein